VDVGGETLQAGASRAWNRGATPYPDSTLPILSPSPLEVTVFFHFLLEDRQSISDLLLVTN
jgi:hypothetical protein